MADEATPKATPKAAKSASVDSPVEVYEVKEGNVHEVHVTTDRVITDPNDPLAVQTEGGSAVLPLPIHALAGRHVEDVFNDA